MITRIRLVVLVAALGTFGFLVTAFHHPRAEEVEDNEPPAVSEADLETYIKVYSAMQEDHDLTIDSAIKPYQMSLDDFRQLERRIQNQPRLVERVRQALFEQAKAHSVFAQASVSPTPEATATAQAHQGTKRK